MLGLAKMVRGLALSPASASPQIKVLGLQFLDIQALGVKSLGVPVLRTSLRSKKSTLYYEKGRRLFTDLGITGKLAELVYYIHES